jgi:deazaflavin-dependent oxidoreductase (nitroreductase family)
MTSWQWFGNAHRAIYRMTNGRIGANLAGRPMLLLTTTGRKSGEPRTTPLSYLRDGDDCIIVASNNGSDRHPAWWLNLEAQPKAQIKVGREAWTVDMLVADGAEYARLWPLLLDYNPQYAGYKAKTRRKLPVVILRRRSAGI